MRNPLKRNKPAAGWFTENTEAWAPKATVLYHGGIWEIDSADGGVVILSRRAAFGRERVVGIDPASLVLT